MLVLIVLDLFPEVQKDRKNINMPSESGGRTSSEGEQEENVKETEARLQLRICVVV